MSGSTDERIIELIAAELRKFAPDANQIGRAMQRWEVTDGPRVTAPTEALIRRARLMKTAAARVAQEITASVHSYREHRRAGCDWNEAGICTFCGRDGNS